MLIIKYITDDSWLTFYTKRMNTSLDDMIATVHAIFSDQRIIYILYNSI